MDSFSEPYTREGDDISLDKVYASIQRLQEEHKKNGIVISGRIIHVVHSLPLTATLDTKQRHTGPPTPPAEPSEDTGSAPIPSKSEWSIEAKHGHAAMISGIQSLSATHEQVIVGWTGDILTPGASANASTTNTTADKIPSKNVSQEERQAFEESLKGFNPDDDKEATKTSYVPVWLDDKVAHGHYDGYCKQSVSWLSFVLEFDSVHAHSSLADVPLSSVARCSNRGGLS